MCWLKCLSENSEVADSTRNGQSHWLDMANKGERGESDLKRGGSMILDLHPRDVRIGDGGGL